MTQNSELKFEVNDLYKNRPVIRAGVPLKKNDMAIITAFVVKF